MIDLHIHSTCSDGSCTPIEILKKAEEEKLEIISITDHETAKAHIELEDIDIKKYYKGKVIKGTEVKAYYKGKIIDILGYNINPKQMEEWLLEFYKHRTFEKVQLKYLEHQYAACKKLGIKLTPIEEVEWNSKEWANIFIYNDFKKYPENESKVPKDLWEDYHNFRHLYCYNPESEFYIDKSQDFPSLKEMLGVIKETGGISFLAHAYMYKWAKDKIKFINDIIENYEIDGLECYYSRFTQEENEYITNLCKERNLYMSGGTDYHGERSPEIEMGIGKGDLKVSKEIISPWMQV